MPRKDSNLDKENQNLLCYLYTTGQEWIDPCNPNLLGCKGREKILPIPLPSPS